MSLQMTKEPTRKASELLDQHKMAIIEELGNTAFDLLTPRQTATMLGVKVPRLSDLNKEKWLEPAAQSDIGHANLYYRWRVEFIKRHRTFRPRKGEKATI